MDEDQVIRTIVEQCTDMNGFLVNLHSLDSFNTANFNTLLDALNKYAHIISGRSSMNRKVAGCLLALNQEMLIKLQETEVNSDKYNYLDQAHVSVTLVTDQIFET